MPLFVFIDSDLTSAFICIHWLGVLVLNGERLVTANELSSWAIKSTSLQHWVMPSASVEVHRPALVPCGALSSLVACVTVAFVLGMGNEGAILEGILATGVKGWPHLTGACLGTLAVQVQGNCGQFLALLLDLNVSFVSAKRRLLCSTHSAVRPLRWCWYLRADAWKRRGLHWCEA